VEYNGIEATDFRKTSNLKASSMNPGDGIRRNNTVYATLKLRGERRLGERS
jgi:hypothetical protein